MAVRRALSGQPANVGAVDRMRVATAVAATADPLRYDLRPEAVAAVGRSLVSTLVDSFGPSARPGSIAARLWPVLCPRPAQPGEIEVVNTALVLLADHELAASTLGARVAASTWADPYLVVQTGLGVLGGPLHGGASRRVVSFLSEAVGAGRDAAQVVGDQLRTGGVPGLGHKVYRGPDPRASVLFSAVERVAGGTLAWGRINQILGLMAERGLPDPNIDLALGAASVCLRLEPDAGEAVFAVARIAGWLAHAIEEYPHRLRFRPRAVYLGPPPRD
jgi:citrate synthase